MKLLLSLLLMLLVISGCSSTQFTISSPVKDFEEKPQDSWVGEDKFKHFTASFWVTGISANITHHSTSPSDALAVGIGLSLTVGLAKEIRDGFQPGNHFCWKDLVWDLLGVISAHQVVIK